MLARRSCSELLESQGVSHRQRHQIDSPHFPIRPNRALLLGEPAHATKAAPSRPDEERDRMPAMSTQNGRRRMIARDDEHIGSQIEKGGDALIQLFQRCNFPIEVTVLSCPISPFE